MVDYHHNLLYDQSSVIYEEFRKPQGGKNKKKASPQDRK